MTPSSPSRARAGLLPAAGAVVLTFVAVGGTVGFLSFQGKEQQRFLLAKSHGCEQGSRDACDALRSLCLKRDGDACVSLADAHFGPGPNHDVREGARLLEEGCTYRVREACSRAGRLLLEGKELPKDVTEAKRLLSRGCAIKTEADCTLAATLP